MNHKVDFGDQIAARQLIIDAVESFGYVQHYEAEHIAALAPYLTFAEVQMIAGATAKDAHGRFAIPPTHFDRMVMVGRIEHKGPGNVEYGDWYDYLSVNHVSMVGKPLNSAEEQSRSGVPFTDRALRYARTHWPELLGNDLGRGYIFWRWWEKDKANHNPGLCIALARPWNQIVSVERTPLSQTIDNYILHIGHERAFSLQIAANAHADAVFYGCSECGYPIRNLTCSAGCKVQKPQYFWGDVTPSSPAFGEKVEKYLRSIGSKTDGRMARHFELEDWKKRKEHREEAARLRRFVADGELAY